MKKHRIASTRKHADAYSELVALGVPAEDIAVHDWNSDLYVRKTPLTERWLDGYEFKDNVETFIDEIDHEPWYDVPFGNGMFFEKALTKGWRDRYSHRAMARRKQSATYEVVDNSWPGTNSDYDEAIIRGGECIAEIGYNDVFGNSYYIKSPDGSYAVKEDYLLDSETPTPRDVIEEAKRIWGDVTASRRPIPRHQYRARKSANRRGLRAAPARRFATVSDAGFQSDIMDFLTDRLYDYEGNVFYGGDMAMELTDAENMDGGWIIGYSKALDYICEHRLVSAEVFDNFKFEFGETPNPFENPEGFTYYMLDYGVRNLLGGSKFLDGHWDEEIELTPEVIETIIGEIDGTRAAGRRMGNRRRVR